MTARRIAAFHEAGHARAARMRGALVESVSITNHGAGLTNVEAKRLDLPFFAFGGMWAEAYFLWERDCGQEMDDDYVFDDYLIGVELEQSEDAAALRSGVDALAQMIGRDPESVRSDLEAVWRLELAEEWPRIAALAARLERG